MAEGDEPMVLHEVKEGIGGEVSADKCNNRNTKDIKTAASCQR